MKNLRKFLLFIGLILCSLSSCKTQKKYDLSLNLKQGHTYSQDFNTSMNIKQSYNGQQLNTKVAMKIKLNYKVLDKKNDTYDLVASYQSLYMSFGLPNGQMATFSSQNGDTTTEMSKIVSKLFKQMLDKPFHIKMTTKGKIIQVTGLDSIWSNIIDQYPELTAVERQKIKLKMEKSFGDKAEVQRMEKSHLIYPENLVAIGDSWTITRKIHTTTTLNQTTTYTLTGKTDSTFEITGSSKISSIKSKNNISGLKFQYNLKGNMTVNASIDNKSGWAINQNGTMTLKGKMHYLPSDKMPEGMDIPIEMIIKFSVTK